MMYISMPVEFNPPPPNLSGVRTREISSLSLLDALREAAKNKVLFLLARPLRPYPPPSPFLRKPQKYSVFF